MEPNEILWHAKFTRAFDRALLYFLELDPGYVLLLTGASGVGKSQITKLLVKKHELSPEQKYIHNVTPIVRISAKPYQEGGFFSIKDMWWGALKQIDHILVHSRKSQPRFPTSELAYAFQESLLAMKTRYLIIDEAQQMRAVRGGDANARRLLDALKSFAEASEVVLVLSGAYPLLGTVDLGPQLSRRTHTIVMHRYHSDRSGDLAEFARIVRWFADRHNLDYQAYIEPLLPEVYLKSLGVLGMVENVMIEIKVKLKERKVKKPDRQCVTSIVEEIAVPDSILEEIEGGEEYLAQRGSGSKSISPGRLSGSVVRKKKNGKKSSRIAKDFGKSAVFK